MDKGFRGCHPIVNITFYLSVIIFGMVLNHPVCLFSSLIGATLFYIKIIGKKAVKSFFTFLFPMLIFVTLINTLFNHNGNTILVTIPLLGNITLEAIWSGFVTSVTLVSVIEWFFTYNEVVTTDKFMFIFGRILPNFALVISMSLRFVPFYKDKLAEISAAQKGIGKGHKTGSIAERIKNGSSILVILITWALENAIETADSMKARGYGAKGRKIYSKFIFENRDKFILAFILSIDAFLVSIVIFGTLKCSYNTTIIINPLNTFGIIGVLSYITLNLLPITIEIWEERKWHSLKSKI